MCVVTHEMRIERQVVDDVIFMDDGQLVETDPPRPVYPQDSDPLTRHDTIVLLGRFFDSRQLLQ